MDSGLGSGGSGGLGGLGGSGSKYAVVPEELQDMIDDEMFDIYEFVRKFAVEPSPEIYHDIAFRVSFRCCCISDCLLKFYESIYDRRSGSWSCSMRPGCCSHTHTFT